MELSTTIFIPLICFNSIFYTSMGSGLTVWPTPQLCCCTLEFHLHYSYLIPITVILTMMLPMVYHSQLLLLLDSQLFSHSQPSGFLLCISMLHIYFPHTAHSQHLSPPYNVSPLYYPPTHKSVRLAIFPYTSMSIRLAHSVDLHCSRLSLVPLSYNFWGTTIKLFRFALAFWAVAAVLHTSAFVPRENAENNKLHYKTL